jgi:hypothetical protein
MVSNATYTIGFQILKKIFEKKFGGYAKYVLPLAGWVGMSIEHVSSII